MLDEESFIREVVTASNPSIKVKSVTPYGGIFNSHQANEESAQNIFENNPKYIYYGVINASKYIGSVFYNGVLLKSSSFKHPLLFDFISGCFSFVGYRIEVDGKPVNLYAQPIQDNNGGGNNGNGGGDNGGNNTNDDVFIFNPLNPSVFDFALLKDGFKNIIPMTMQELSNYRSVIQRKYSDINLYIQVIFNAAAQDSLTNYSFLLTAIDTLTSQIPCENIGQSTNTLTQFVQYYNPYFPLVYGLTDFFGWDSTNLNISYHQNIKLAAIQKINWNKTYAYCNPFHPDLPQIENWFNFNLPLINAKISELENSTNPENGGSGGNGGTNQQA